MLSFESIIDMLNILVIEPKGSGQSIQSLNVLKESSDATLINSTDESMLHEPDVMELEGYDIIIVNALQECSDAYMQQLNLFCTKFSYIPILAVINNYNEESVLSYLSLGIQDVLDFSDKDMLHDTFNLKVKSAISRQLKTRMCTESEDLYKVLREYTLDMVFLVTEDSSILYVSPNIDPILGHKVHDCIGTSFIELLDVSSQSTVKGMLDPERTIKGEVYRRSIKLKNSTGELIDVDFTIRNKIDDLKVGCFVVNCHLQIADESALHYSNKEEV